MSDLGGSVSTRCKRYTGDFVLGCHAKDMVVLCFGKLMGCEPRARHWSISICGSLERRSARIVVGDRHHVIQRTPPFLPIPLPTPSTSRRADISEANTPPRKRLLTTPRPGCEVGESSAAAAARQPGPTIETRLRDTERRMMTALELVNRRITYQVDVCTRESSEFCTRHHDAQEDRAAVRAEIEILRRERLAYEQESLETRQALARSEAHCRTLEARVAVLETEVHRHEWQRQAADDLAVQHIMRTQALEAGARIDTLEDTGSSS
ncbi:hypothetical protein Tco_0559791 [Tanacetum coccineum]